MHQARVKFTKPLTAPLKSNSCKNFILLFWINRKDGKHKKYKYLDTVKTNIALTQKSNKKTKNKKKLENIMINILL